MNDPNKKFKVIIFICRVRREGRIRIDHRYLYEGGLMNDCVMMTECDGGTGRALKLAQLEDMFLTSKATHCSIFKLLFLSRDL